LAISHHTSEILAYTFGGRTHAVLQALKHLLEPLNITKYFTDGLLAYQRLLSHEKHEEGKRNTQKIERKFLTLTVSSLKEMCENRFETPPFFGARSVNHFSIKYKLLLRANQIAMQELKNMVC